MKGVVAILSLYNPENAAHLWRVKTPTEMTGKKIGRWTVLRLDSIRRSNAYWVCVCQCGKEKAVAATSLKNGQSLSCGCVRRETKPALTHGMTYSPTWRSWTKMKQRAGMNKRQKHHEHLYSHVDADPCWASFEEFLKDMGERPSRAHSLDRIDNSKGYWKDNCRWVTQAVQSGNRRNNIVVELDGQRICLKDACRKVGMHYLTVYSRMLRGMSFQSAISKPLRRATGAFATSS
jgi:hypothetical protein